MAAYIATSICLDCTRMSTQNKFSDLTAMKPISRNKFRSEKRWWNGSNQKKFQNCKWHREIAVGPNSQTSRHLYSSCRKIQGYQKVLYQGGAGLT
ncbi:hypothetical protein QTO34_001240 [Cnephaeus nilssonii]|uniref:Uncharacterized protein n=1 Tax=Cnephaeus nilssonii TaxID=3371016 RepID=A0AA40LM40_CNENI|nr:hypothetical protein QTO34_001240 [Eptesicus nilssonii]